MKNAFIRNTVSSIALAALTLPVVVHADCVPTAPVGWSVPFEMISLESFRASNSPAATYVAGELTYTAHNDALFRGTTLSGANNRELFSDRTYCRGKFLECTESQFVQPFDIDQAGKLSISITDGDNLLEVHGTELLVTFNNKQSYTGVCDPTSGELYFTSSEHMYVMTFGIPTPPPPPPPK